MKTTICPACGFEETGYFCRHCGTRLTDEEVVRCHHCGQVVPAGGFCNLCGWEIPPDALHLTTREDMPDWLRSLGAGSYPPPRRESVQATRAAVIVGIGLVVLFLLGLMVMGLMLAARGG